ncbi:MAG: AAA-like domain-containing protein [Coleofasciculaceae cyanobacterium]
MNVEQALAIVEGVILSRQLSTIERFILCQSWQGQTYNQMAADSTYGIPHIKEVGSQLWQELSQAIGDRVTKKNLHLVLSQYQQNLVNQPTSSSRNKGREDDTLAHSSKTKSNFPGGPLSLNSPLYIQRYPIEEQACSEISRPGCIIRIRAARRMGKSSLLNRVLAHATALGYKTVYLDFQEAEEDVFASIDKFLRWFSANVSSRLNLKHLLDDYWDEEMGSKVSCKIYFEAYLLEKIDTPIVLALNEVNRVFEHSQIAQEFFAMLRFWHEQAQQVETWQKLRLIVTHSTEVYIPLKLNQSPFNVGLAINLPPLSLEQVHDLAQRYGLNWQDNRQVKQLMAMVGGHPYLISVALHHLSLGNITLEELLLKAPTLAGIYNHHLRSYLTILQSEPILSSALRQVATREDGTQLDAITAYKLESLGLVKLENNWIKPSCQLYRLYFQQQLKEDFLEVRLEQLEKEKQEVLRLYNFDELTQLPNQNYFEQYLETHWQKWVKEAEPLSLILCDIDYFRFYNQTHGQLAGDSCLQIITRTISASLEDKTAIVTRYGGEEFAIILPQTNGEVAVEIAENIRAKIQALEIQRNQPLVDGFPAPVLTASLGVVAVIPSPSLSLEMLIAEVNIALSLSKKQGRNCVVLNQ